MDEYLYKMDLIDVQNAVHVSRFPKEIANWIWEEKHEPFEMF